MSRKSSLPGVDEEALATLARQFPGNTLRAEEPSRESERSSRDEYRTITSSTAEPVEAVRVRSGGRGLAVVAFLLALIAILMAATTMMPRSARDWVSHQLAGKVPPKAIDLLTGNRAEFEARLTGAADALKALQDRAAALDARLAAIEAVGGSSNAAAKRVDALEAAMTAANRRLASLAEQGRTDNGRIGALEGKVTALEGDLKAESDRASAMADDIKSTLTPRLAAVETDVGDLKKIDRRPEKLFLVALQLRNVTQTSAPFMREVAAARTLAGNNADVLAALKVLATFAQNGVATPAELRETFATFVAPKLAAIVSTSKPPVAERTKAWLESWFSGASSGGAQGDRNATIAALAQRSLDQGQLSVAVDQLLLLEDQAALVTAEWLKNASARLATDKATATVMAQAFDQLASSN